MLQHIEYFRKWRALQQRASLSLSLPLRLHMVALDDNIYALLPHTSSVQTKHHTSVYPWHQACTDSAAKVSAVGDCIYIFERVWGLKMQRQNLASSHHTSFIKLGHGKDNISCHSMIIQGGWANRTATKYFISFLEYKYFSCYPDC